MGNDFATQYPRNSQGWILFPDEDRQGGLRSQLFKERVEHPSKNQLLMMEEIVCYCTQGIEAAVILDPMAGAGSTMIGAQFVKTCILIELEEYFFDRLQVNKQWFRDNIVVIKGDCLKVLPSLNQSIDLITFSPPYSNQIRQNKGTAQYEADKSGSANSIVNYTAHPDNLSNKPDFQFNELMRRVYGACFKALKPGRYMVIIIKDQIRNWKRIDFGTQHVRMACKEGFVVDKWERHDHTGKLFGYYNKQQGVRVVEDEHILFFRRPT